MMQPQLEPGTYVLAISGGVDSMVLLDILHRQAGLKLIVAHLDHGLRNDSAQDRQLVQAAAKQLGRPFAYHEAGLGPNSSEAKARQVRYDFLHQVRRAGGARAIVTAHHQDDVLETAILNLMRGSGRKGLTSLSSRSGVERPLLHIPKSALIAYARDQGLQWREDSTNTNLDYVRNYVRHRVLPRFDKQARLKLWNIITDLKATNDELDTLLVNQLHVQPVAGQLNRQWFNQLPHDVAREVVATWLRAHEVRDFDRSALERLVVAAKVAAPGKTFDVLRGVILVAGKRNLALREPER